jgi:hemoglobin
MTMTMTTESGAAGASIYDAIGGRPAVRAAVDGLFERLLADPELAPFFPRGASEVHRAYLVTFLGEALGGPERYRGRDVAAAHGGLRISDVHFDRTAGHLVATLDTLSVPAGLTDRVVRIVAGLRPAVVSA